MLLRGLKTSVALEPDPVVGVLNVTTRVAATYPITVAATAEDPELSTFIPTTTEVVLGRVIVEEPEFQVQPVFVIVPVVEVGTET